MVDAVAVTVETRVLEIELDAVDDTELDLDDASV